MSNITDSMTEKNVTEALAAAIVKQLEARKVQCAALENVIVFGLFLENPMKAGTESTRRDVNGPRINISCNPAIPHGYGSRAHTCKISIDCITRPDDDPDQRLAVQLYQAVWAVLNYKEFTLPAAQMELRGYLISESDAGMSDDGFVIKLGVRMELFVK